MGRESLEVPVTYSIVARDPATGQLGVAVQTAMFAVGSIVPWAQAGVGAVATQAISEVAYGPWCLEALETGRTASDALDDARAKDVLAELRQVGVVGADGSVATWTGALCIDHAGGVAGDGFAVQANMMASPDVWPAMADAFTSSTGALARRLLATLVAGQRAGGDARGVMSAAIVVVQGDSPALPGGGAIVNARVDRSDDPLGDLAGLVDAAEAFAGFNKAVEQLMSGDPQASIASLDRSLLVLPAEENFLFLRAGALIASGDVAAGVAELRALVGQRPSWAVVVRSFAHKGLIATPSGLSIDDILSD